MYAYNFMNVYLDTNLHHNACFACQHVLTPSNREMHDVAMRAAHNCNSHGPQAQSQALVRLTTAANKKLAEAVMSKRIDLLENANG